MAIRKAQLWYEYCDIMFSISIGIHTKWVFSKQWTLSWAWTCIPPQIAVYMYNIAEIENALCQISSQDSYENSNRKANWIKNIVMQKIIERRGV